jgi:hypothetical protein
MYSLYHIKGVKWGCTKNLEKRLKNQGYSISNLDRLITVGNIDKAAEMERELNLEYEYGWNTGQDYRHTQKMGTVGGNTKSILRSEKASITGKKTGPINVHIMLAKRPSVKGEGNSRATLTNNDVISIRNEYPLYKSKYGLYSILAEKYNTTTRVIQKIIRKETWKHI